MSIPDLCILGKSCAELILTKPDTVDVQILQDLDILVNKGIARDEGGHVCVIWRRLLDHVGAMEESSTTLSINELLVDWVNANDLGEVSSDQRHRS